MSRPAQGFCSIVCALAVALGGCTSTRSTDPELFDPHESCIAEQDRLRAEREEVELKLKAELHTLQDDLQVLRRHAERLAEELAASRETSTRLQTGVDAAMGLIRARDQELIDLKRRLEDPGRAEAQGDLAAQLLIQKDKEIRELREELVRIKAGEERVIPEAVRKGIVPSIDLDQPVATVDGQVLTRRDLAEYMYGDLATKQLVDPFVNRHLVLRAANRLGITVTDAECEAFVAREVLDQVKQAGSEPAWLERLAQMGYDRRGWESRLRYQARPMLLLFRLVERERETTTGRELFEQRIRQAFEQTHSTRVSGRHILFALPPQPNADQVARAQQQAKQVLQMLAQGMSFADLAQRYSQDPDTRRLGGYLGEFERDKLADLPELNDAFFTLPEGRPSQPIRTRLGFHLALVDERRAPQRGLDEAMRRELAERLRGEPPSPEEQAAVINRLRREAQIRTMLGISND